MARQLKKLKGSNESNIGTSPTGTSPTGFSPTGTSPTSTNEVAYRPKKSNLGCTSYDAFANLASLPGDASDSGYDMGDFNADDYEEDLS